MTTLVIVESPAKATKIQEYLGKDYIVMASKGHITELAKGGRYGLGVDIENDFKPHYVLSADKISTLQDLMDAAKICDQILLFSDPDREGNSIAWHLQQRLQDLGKPIKRGIFNEIKKSAILKAIKEAGEIDMQSVHAQEARRILDRLVGFLASPYLANFFGNKHLSSGRVQSVLTRMVIDREESINSFVPETYFTIQVDLTKDRKDSFQAKYSGKLTEEKIAQAMKTKLSGKEYIVSEVSAAPEKKYPQPPLITSTLQRIMSKEHGFSSDRTMKAAQSLYEMGYCTYIRTDSVRQSDEALEEVRQYLKDHKVPVPKKPHVYKNKDAAQDAHECIRPSDLTLEPDNNYAMVDPDEKLVYETIWKQFVASQAMPAIYNTLKVSAHVKGDKTAEVKASGKALSSRGYLEVLGITDNSQIDIPNLKIGDSLYLVNDQSVKLEKKQTQPLPRYSEDKLIKELVNKGIGRPATFSELLSKVCARNYVEKRGVVYHATDLGKKITNDLCKYFTFMDYDYTKKLEDQLDLIEAGKLDYIEMLKQFYPAFKKELDKAYLEHGGSLCNKCGSPMATRVAKDGHQFLSCSAFPRCKNAINLPDEKKVA